jgi:hypothetical protein
MTDRDRDTLYGSDEEVLPSNHDDLLDAALEDMAVEGLFFQYYLLITLP